MSADGKKAGAVKRVYLSQRETLFSSSCSKLYVHSTHIPCSHVFFFVRYSNSLFPTSRTWSGVGRKEGREVPRGLDSYTKVQIGMFVGWGGGGQFVKVTAGIVGLPLFAMKGNARGFHRMVFRLSISSHGTAENEVGIHRSSPPLKTQNENTRRGRKEREKIPCLGGTRTSTLKKLKSRKKKSSFSRSISNHRSLLFGSGP